MELKLDLVLPGVKGKILIDFMKHKYPDSEGDQTI